MVAASMNLHDLPQSQPYPRALGANFSIYNIGNNEWNDMWPLWGEHQGFAFIMDGIQWEENADRDIFP